MNAEESGLQTCGRNMVGYIDVLGPRWKLDDITLQAASTQDGSLFGGVLCLWNEGFFEGFEGFQGRDPVNWYTWTTLFCTKAAFWRET